MQQSILKSACVMFWFFFFFSWCLGGGQVDMISPLCLDQESRLVVSIWSFFLSVDTSETQSDFSHIISFRQIRGVYFWLTKAGALRRHTNATQRLPKS